MLGFSLGKLLLLALLIAAVWFLFRAFTGGGSAGSAGGAAGDGGAAGRDVIDAEDMTQCRVCGTYISATKPSACSRADCPYRR
ncbi:MAG TPA: hypothetical protein VEU47_03485 [Candidatus Cybelea sp.]|nr:hypothetical protein [Candidatus Cybelea sp.]